MTAITLWGPATWDLFHTLVCKLKPEHFQKVSYIVFNFITQICHNLPCPSCTEHAKQYLSKVNKNRSFLTDKTLFINLLYVFHNSVNGRNNKNLFKYEDISAYNNKSLIVVFNNFVKYFHSDGNLSLINENFHRKRLVSTFKQWLTKNINYFNP